MSAGVIAAHYAAASGGGSSTISLVGTASGGASLVVPAATQAGDLIFVLANAQVSGVVATNDTWQQLASNVASYNNPVVFYKVAVAGDAGTAKTFTLPTRGSAVMIVYRSAVFNSISGLVAVNMGAVTTPFDRCVVVRFAAAGNSTASTSVSVSGTNVTQQVAVANRINCAIGDETVLVAGPSGTATIGGNTGNNPVGWNMILSPA